MKFSVSFLATSIDQLPSPKQYDQDAVEAIVFDREDLELAQWNLIWENIEKAVKIYGGEQVSFHFPINDCNFVKDRFVRERLIEGLRRATDLNLRGVVIHPNQTEPELWSHVDFPAKRIQVVDVLLEIREKIKGKTWLGLENMPVLDNDLKTMDPLFVFPCDFLILAETNIKVVWDVCHFAKTLAHVAEVVDGKQNLKYYPNIRQVGELDFLSIRDLIVHWHFSAFLGIANPEKGTVSEEGVHPVKSTIGESLYKKILKNILETSSEDEHMVFEIQEKDYASRIEVKETIKWARSHVCKS